MRPADTTWLAWGLAIAAAVCLAGGCDVEAEDETPAADASSANLGAAPDEAAVPLDDSRIVGWAAAVHDVTYGAEVDEEWRHPERALGPATGNATDVLCLGRGGVAVLSFEPAIADGDGDDFAVFENGFTDTFLELGYVEVSSDGVTFVRFDSVSQGTEPVAQYGAVDPAGLSGLAGTYRRGFGTPFDLALLAERDEVRDGRVDLARVGFVRIVDVVGDGSASDSRGQPIYDPYPTIESAGFDLEAIAVLRGSR